MRPPHTPPPTLQHRTAGVLLHMTSLPGPDGSGDLGREAHDFVDTLAAAEAGWWQMLPVVAPGPGLSPYSSPSAFAGNPYLVDFAWLRERGLLEAAQPGAHIGPADRIDPAAMASHREGALRRAFVAWRVHRPSLGDAGDRTLEDRGDLLEYARFLALRAHFGGRPWTAWPNDARDREAGTLRALDTELAEPIEFHLFVQALFEAQWEALRAHATSRGVALLGDIPIFVDADSADVWASRHAFDLREDGTPRVVAGVPPDAFSATGQRWGNALYRWDALKEDGYGWWMRRLAAALARFDAVRIDHFIGFHRYWEIPAEEPTALVGEFRPGPGHDFFRAVEQRLGLGRLIAEDLGIVTPEVNALREDFRIPGMRVLQFSMSPDPGAEGLRPHHYPEDSVAYTGTHDNDTTQGWLDALAQSDAGRAERAAVEAYAAEHVGSEGGALLPRLIRLVLGTRARLAVVPMQDLLGLGNAARMNHPGTTEGNWLWRMEAGAFTDAHAAWLRQAIEESHRTPPR